MEGNKDKFSGVKGHTEIVSDSELLKPVWDLKENQRVESKPETRPAEAESPTNVGGKKSPPGGAVNPAQKPNNPPVPPQQLLAQQIQKTNQAMTQLTDLAGRMTESMGEFVMEIKGLNKGNAFTTDSMKRLQATIDNAVADGNRNFLIITFLLLSAMTLMGWYLVKNKPIAPASVSQLDTSGINDLRNTLLSQHNEVLNAVQKVSTDQTLKTQVVETKLNNLAADLNSQIDKKLSNTKVQTIYKTCIKHKHKNRRRWHTHCW